MALVSAAAIAIAAELSTPTTFADAHFDSDRNPPEFLPKLVLWNASASVPRGLYWLRPADHFHVGELVTAAPPSPLASYAAARNYLPAGVPLLKHIGALPSQEVCRFGHTVTIDGHTTALARGRDIRGRPLPVWQGCRRLGAGQVFLLNAGVPGSFDGRYFGVLSSSTITASAVPIWTIPER